MKYQWLQARVYFNKNNSKDVIQDIFINRKIIFIKRYVNEIKNKLINDYSVKWHFLGLYFKDNTIYLDLRFKILEDDKSKVESIITNELKGAITDEMIEDKIEFDTSFYSDYSTKFNESQIITILNILELFSNKYLEILNSENDINLVQKKLNKEYVEVLCEVNHLIFSNQTLMTLFTIYLWHIYIRMRNQYWIYYYQKSVKRINLLMI